VSFVRYPKYKDSGVAWLGDVPEHWGVRKLKRFARFTYGDALAADVRDEAGDIKVFGSNGPVGIHNVANTRAPAVLVGRKGSCGAVNWTNQAAFAIDTVYFVDDSSSQCELRWLYWLLQTLRLDDTSQDTGVPGLSREVVHDLRVLQPSSEEQAAIAAFLDRETAKIDALIAEQEKLIALLKEKRQALISNAVTQGLDPNAPMKDSGIEWLGQVPARWNVCPLKYLSRIGNGSTPNRDNPEYWDEKGFPWLNSSVVNQDEVTEAQRFVTALALKECHLPVLKPPAVLVGITGQGKTRGMAAPLMFEATINQHVAYIKPEPERLRVAYLLCVLEMAYEHLRTESEGSGSTKGAITCNQLSCLSIPLPPMEEQNAITDYLDAQATKFDRLADDSRRTIDLLKARRAALISAAVTGKIDVRDKAASNKQDESRAIAGLMGHGA